MSLDVLAQKNKVCAAGPALPRLALMAAASLLVTACATPPRSPQLRASLDRCRIVVADSCLPDAIQYHPANPRGARTQCRARGARGLGLIKVATTGPDRARKTVEGATTTTRSTVRGLQPNGRP